LPLKRRLLDGERRRESTRKLLQDSTSSIAEGFGQSVSEKTRADDRNLETIAKQVAAECCFKCCSSDTQYLWGYCHMYPDGTLCREFFENCLQFHCFDV
jgi:hypothetical protein